MRWFIVRGYRDANGEQEELAYALVWTKSEAHAAELAWQNQGFVDSILMVKEEHEAIILVATPG